MQCEGVDQLFNMDMELQFNDQLVIIGNVEVVEEVIMILGEVYEKEFFYDWIVFDVCWFFVLNLKIVGEKIVLLNLVEQFLIIIMCV